MNGEAHLILPLLSLLLEVKTVEWELFSQQKVFDLSILFLCKLSLKDKVFPFSKFYILSLGLGSDICICKEVSIGFEGGRFLAVSKFPSSKFLWYTVLQRQRIAAKRSGLTGGQKWVCLERCYVCLSIFYYEVLKTCDLAVLFLHCFLLSSLPSPVLGDPDGFGSICPLPLSLGVFCLWGLLWGRLR